MGNSQERRQELLQYEPQLINYTLHHTHTPLYIYRHLYSSAQIMQHREIIYNYEDISRKLQTFYSRYQHLFLVSSQYLKLQAQNACNDGDYEMRTFYERVVTNLSKVNDIPFNDSLYCYSVALRGFELLFKSYGYFQVFQNMFHICQQGKLKVWCNQHIYKSVPEQYLLGSGKQSDMVIKVISIIDQNTQYNEEYLNIKELLIGLQPLNFATARARFMEICSQRHFYVSQYLQSLQQSAHIEQMLDIYSGHSSKPSRVMQAFDTGLTFNPKKTFKSNVVNPISQNNSMRRSSLQSSRVKNQNLPSERGNSYDQFTKKNKRIQIFNIVNQNKQQGFPRFDSSINKSGPKNNWQEQSMRNQSQLYEKIVSPIKYQNKQQRYHQVNINHFANSSSPGSRLKKTNSRQTGPVPQRILFQSKVNEIKEDQLKIIRMPQNINQLSGFQPEIAQDNRYVQGQQIKHQELKVPQKVQQRQIIRSYSQNNANRGQNTLRTSQTKTIRANTQPQFVQKSFQPISPQYIPSQFQRPNTPQSLPSYPSQNNNCVYPIYPVQKVVFQAQPQSSRLKKSTKIQPNITFSQQKFQNNAHKNSEIFYRQSLPAYIQHQKIAQLRTNNQAQIHSFPLKIQSLQRTYTSQQVSSPINVVNQNHLRPNGQIRCIQQRPNNLMHSFQPNPTATRQQHVKAQPISRRGESQPNKLSKIQNNKPSYSGNSIPLQQIQQSKMQKILKVQNESKNLKKAQFEPLGYMKYQKSQGSKDQKKEDRFQIPQIQSKIDMLSSFAENKITTYEFLPNQSHAISGIRWEKGQNSGRDSVSSAFRKQLFPEHSSIRQFQKRPNTVQQKYLDAKPKKQEFLTNQRDHDYLQTDPKLLQLIKSATSNYKKELTKAVSMENKQLKMVQQYSKKDMIKENYDNQAKYKQSRFKPIPQMNQNKSKISAFGGNSIQGASSYPYRPLGKTEMAFKKKTEPYISGNNKISAISQKWDQENICSTSNGSIGKNYLQNLDADILQDMYTYGMEGGKGKFK